ncbi:MAG: dual specificity protein phosphatase family protein [Myxococcota bacterium]
MEPAFDFNEVDSGLWVGPCPSSPQRIQQLRKAGIDGLVSLQTDDDLMGMDLDWNLLWRFMMGQGIAARRQPITDFDDRALIQGLPAAIVAIAELRAAGRVTYVHCSAGVNRSPTVAIGYLMQHNGLSLDQAWQQVTTRRPCDPNRAALERWHLGPPKRG